MSEPKRTSEELALRYPTLTATRPKVELILDIHPSVWNFVVKPGAFRRIVTNLVGNSLTYTKHGFILVSLRPGKVRPGLPTAPYDQDKLFSVVLLVQDTGEGISPEYLRTKIFTPFAKKNAKSVGAGLGLSIVRSIVSMLSGEIDIQSTVGVGTIVTVSLRESALAERTVPQS